MTFVAWAVFLVATGYTIWDGVRRTIGAKSMEEFFAAGRSIPWWAAGLSVMATQLSAITIIGGVGMGYENGLEWVQSYFALPFALVVLCIWFVPMFRKHPVLTAYEHLERRFGPITRTLTSLTFLVSRCLAFGIVLYAPAVVFSVMTGMSIAATVWATGLLTTAYTVLGGIGGVVWTDVKQMLVIVLGIGTCISVLAWETVSQLSFTGVIESLGVAHKLNAVEINDPAWNFTPVAPDGSLVNSFWADKYNLWTGLFGTFFLFLSYFGCDQVQVQSILTSRSVDASRRALLMSAFTKIPLQLMVLFTGGLLYLHHSLGSEPLLFQPNDQERVATLEGEAKSLYDAAALAHAAAAAERATTLKLISKSTEPDLALVSRFRASVAAAEKARKDARAAVGAPGDTNYVFPDFIFRELPKPLLGLMLAAIFAAAISSAAGALSSLTSATMVDLYRRWIRPNADDKSTLRSSKIAMTFWGIAATASAVWLGGGPLLERVNEVGSWFYGSILGVFLLGLMVKRASGLAASSALVGGLTIVVLVHNSYQIAFLWYNLVGCVGALAVGCVVTLAAPKRS